MPTIIDRPAVHSTYYPDRPIKGIVLHDTETHDDITTSQSEGGWHFTIERDGRIFSDVSLDQAAWHVKATGHTADSIAVTRWRPNWLVLCPDGAVSDTNYCTIGIEMVSDLAWRNSGIAYTPAQYAACLDLAGYLYALYGTKLPLVTHGSLQTDRSDPVGFNLSLFSPFVPGQGYFLNESATSPDDMDLQRKINDLNGVIAELQKQLAYKDQLLQECNSHNGALEHDVILPLQEQLKEAQGKGGELATLVQSFIQQAQALVS